MPALEVVTEEVGEMEVRESIIEIERESSEDPIDDGFIETGSVDLLGLASKDAILSVKNDSDNELII